MSIPMDTPRVWVHRNQRPPNLDPGPTGCRALTPTEVLDVRDVLNQAGYTGRVRITSDWDTYAFRHRWPGEGPPPLTGYVDGHGIHLFLPAGRVPPRDLDPKTTLPDGADPAEWFREHFVRVDSHRPANTLDMAEQNFTGINRLDARGAELAARYPEAFGQIEGGRGKPDRPAVIEARDRAAYAETWEEHIEGIREALASSPSAPEEDLELLEELKNELPPHGFMNGSGQVVLPSGTAASYSRTLPPDHGDVTSPAPSAPHPTTAATDGPPRAHSGSDYQTLSVEEALDARAGFGQRGIRHDISFATSDFEVYQADFLRKHPGQPEPMSGYVDRDGLHLLLLPGSRIANPDAAPPPPPGSPDREQWLLTHTTEMPEARLLDLARRHPEAIAGGVEVAADQAAFQRGYLESALDPQLSLGERAYLQALREANPSRYDARLRELAAAQGIPQEQAHYWVGNRLHLPPAPEGANAADVAGHDPAAAHIRHVEATGTAIPRSAPQPTSHVEPTGGTVHGARPPDAGITITGVAPPPAHPISAQSGHTLPGMPPPTAATHAAAEAATAAEHAAVGSLGHALLSTARGLVKETIIGIGVEIAFERLISIGESQLHQTTDPLLRKAVEQAAHQLTAHTAEVQRHEQGNPNHPVWGTFVVEITPEMAPSEVASHSGVSGMEPTGRYQVHTHDLQVTGDRPQAEWQPTANGGVRVVVSLPMNGAAQDIDHALGAVTQSRQADERTVTDRVVSNTPVVGPMIDLFKTWATIGRLDFEAAEADLHAAVRDTVARAIPERGNELARLSAERPGAAIWGVATVVVRRDTELLDHGAVSTLVHQRGPLTLTTERPQPGMQQLGVDEVRLTFVVPANNEARQVLAHEARQATQDSVDEQNAPPAVYHPADGGAAIPAPEEPAAPPAPGSHGSSDGKVPVPDRYDGKHPVESRKALEAEPQGVSAPALSGPQHRDSGPANLDLRPSSLEVPGTGKRVETWHGAHGKHEVHATSGMAPPVSPSAGAERPEAQKHPAAIDKQAAHSDVVPPADAGRPTPGTAESAHPGGAVTQESSPTSTETSGAHGNEATVSRHDAAAENAGPTVAERAPGVAAADGERPAGSSSEQREEVASVDGRTSVAAGSANGERATTDTAFADRAAAQPVTSEHFGNVASVADSSGGFAGLAGQSTIDDDAGSDKSTYQPPKKPLSDLDGDGLTG